MMPGLQRVANVCLVALLRSPLHRLGSGSLLLITYCGRSTGRHFTIPVMYAERAGTLTIYVGHAERKKWWHNLRGGAAVEVRLRGKRLAGRATVVDDGAAAATYLERYPRARVAVEAAEPTFVRVAALDPIDGGEAIPIVS
jgi:hypothetical protein